MKTREEINLALAKMNNAGGNAHYTPGQIQSEGLQECVIEWKSKSEIFKKLMNKYKEWRGNYEHATYIQVCE